MTNYYRTIPSEVRPGLGWLFLSLLALATLAQVCPTAYGADWPTYLHDNARSGVTQERLDPPLAKQWVFVPKHAPEPAWPEPGKERPRVRFDDAYHVTAVGDSVYFGSSADHKVYCLEASTGRVRWTFFTGGPVRLPPTEEKNRLFVGSDDGFVYCLDAANGRVIWKLRGGPTARKVLGNGKMMSVWPVRTGVLVEDGVAYFCAGLFPTESVYVYAVRAEDGRIIWRNDTSGQLYKKMPHAGAEAFSGVVPEGALLASARRLYVPTGRSVPAAFDRQTGRFLYWHPATYKHTGGAWALLSSDLLFSGPAGLTAHNPDKGDRFARFPGRALLVTSDTSYLLSDAELTAVDRKAYAELMGQQTALLNKHSSLRRQQTNLIRAQQELDRKLASLSPEEKARHKDQVALNERKKAVGEELRKVENALNENRKALGACVKWQSKCHSPQTLIFAGGVLFIGGQGEVLAVDAATGEILWRGKVAGRARGLAVANGRLFVSCDTGAIYCFAKGDRPTVAWLSEPTNSRPYPQDRRTALYAAAAERILRETRVRRGYCLVFGCETGRLALELAKRTELRIYGIEPDGRKVEQARAALDAAGLYGTRVTVEQGSLSDLPYSNYFANLIVSDSMLVSGRLRGSAKELFRVLKPCGGVAYLGQPAEGMRLWRRLKPDRLREWLRKGGLSDFEVIQDGGTWAKIVRGPLPGAGEWTHQYADPGNTACSTDRLVECPLGVLWFGEPGPAKMINRHCKAPAPVSTNGRLFVAGNDVVIACDAYNGLKLWERNLPGFRRVWLHGETTNLVAAPESVYATVGEQCLRLDAATGETLAEWSVPPAPDGQPRNWGYLAWTGEILLGSGAPQFTLSALDEDTVIALRRSGVPEAVIQKLGAIRGQPFTTREALVRRLAEVLTAEEMTKYQARILDEPGVPMGGVVSDYVFARNRRTGELLWVHRVQNGYLYHIAIALGGGHMFLAEVGRDKPGTRRLIALDLQSGEKVWEKEIEVSGWVGADLTLIYQKNVLLLAGAGGGRRIMALSAADGELLWSRSIAFTRHLVVNGNTIYAQPGAYDLRTGEPKTRIHPFTGRREPWQFARAYGCGAISGAPSSLFFRSGTVGFYDLKADAGTSNWGGMRPGCWINIIPAGGLVLIPEASSGCTCSYPIQTSIALIPRERKEYWSIFVSPGETTPVKHLAINFGAPGDRRDRQGTLWLAYPRPPAAFGIQFPIRSDILKGLGYFRRNAEYFPIQGTDKPWVFASGCCGLSRCVLPLIKKGQEPAVYTVRLHFAELSHERRGRRVFEVRVQGQTLLEDFDILEVAQAPNRAVVREFRDIPVTDNLIIEFVPQVANPTQEEAPLVCGLEVLRQGGEQ